MDKAQAADRERNYLQSLEEMQRLRRFDGDPSRFWRTYLGVLVFASEADSGIIAVRVKSAAMGWRILTVCPDALLSGGIAETMLNEVAGTAAAALDTGASRSESDGRGVLAVRLQTDTVDEGCVGLFFTARLPPAEAVERMRRVQLASDIPASYQLARVAAEARTRVAHFAGVLDLMVLINAEKKFLSAAMTFCNELASRHGCERVSLGWLEKGYIHLQSTSRADRFERKTEAVQRLEAAMEEAIDQNTEIILPPSEPGGPVQRDHKTYAAAYDVTHACSLPLRVDGEPVGACTCERSSSPFPETEMRLLRLSCDQAARRLADLKRSDRWIGARLAAGVREKLALLLGYQHTGAKAIAILVAALLGVVFFGQFDYRVKASAVLRTDDLVNLTAPFDGHLEKVLVRVGDAVAGGQELVSLDRTDLLLREAELVAEKTRYEREFEKAQGSNALADMRITTALRDQAAARLELARYQIDRAVIRALFAGVIVEGDLFEKIGSPVRQGDLLLKLGRMERLYAELEVNEADIHEISGELSGEMALASRPQERFAIKVTRVEPVAVAKEKKNVFVVKAALTGDRRDWWRPGMSGVARVGVGKRSLLWIITHRTLDFLRLRLWW
ncbi:MAG: HlyD family efflux transporter periplasmic adaptor subunit [Spirochaetia bacterium]|jgi:multidrug efflux pump subunit AcrA (membrane-fusion protein)